MSKTQTILRLSDNENCDTAMARQRAVAVKHPITTPTKSRVSKQKIRRETAVQRWKNHQFFGPDRGHEAIQLRENVVAPIHVVIRVIDIDANIVADRRTGRTGIRIVAGSEVATDNAVVIGHDRRM